MVQRSPMICTRCGWAEAPPSTAASVVGGAMSVTKFAIRTGGGLGAAFGGVMKGLGIALIVIGIPFLLIGIGAIMIGVGVVFWLLSIFFSAGGRMVAGSAGVAPKACPACGATDLIPISSPVAKKFIAEHGLSA